MIDLSIVVVSWNTRDLLLQCVRCARRALAEPGAPLEAELIVVDNGSSDGSAQAVAAAAPEVRVIALPENRGFAAGNNAGLGVARGRILLLLNSDAEITRKALDAALAFFAAHPDAGAAGVELVHPDGRLQNAVHAFPSLLAELLPRALLARLAPRRFPTKECMPEVPTPVEAVLGAVLFVRREVWEEIGGLDESYFFFLEETDWCWRMAEAGFRVYHLPGAPVRHLSGGSSKRRFPAATRIEFHRSLYLFLDRHRGRSVRRIVSVLRFLRALGTGVLQLPLLPFSARARGRLAERWQLLRWHARGCPPGGGLREVARGGAPR